MPQLPGRGLIASILRFSQFARADLIEDGTWTSASLECYTIMEPSMYLLASCLPSSKPILTQIQLSLGSSRFSALKAWSPMSIWKAQARGTRDSLRSQLDDNTSETEMRHLKSSTADNESQLNVITNHIRIFSITSEGSSKMLKPSTKGHGTATPNSDHRLHY